MNSTRKKQLPFIISIVALSLAAILFITLMTVFYYQKENYKNKLLSVYNKAYYELMSNVNNMEVKLSKLLVSSGVTMRGKLLSDLSRQADEAEYNLSELPMSSEDRMPLSAFLNRVNGYAEYLSGHEGAFSEEQYQQITNMHNNCRAIAEELHSMSGQMNARNLDLNFNNRQKDSGLTYGEKIHSLDYPELIYDGPFSDAQNTFDVKGAAGAEIDSEQGVGIIRNIWSDKVNEVTYRDVCSARYFEVLCYNVKMSDGTDGYIQLAKKGGMPILFDSSSTTGEGSIDKETAISAAEAFVSGLGLADMKPVWYCGSDYFATINFAPEQDGILLYPDLVKIKVSLTDGKIQGLEAMNYYCNHADRTLSAPEVASDTPEISPRLNIQSERLALIPKDTTEILAKEITAEADGLTYFIYLDAATGRELDIFRVVDTEQGELLI